MNYNKWCSIWGNAMSISENRPESYSRNITLRYPIFCPFSGRGIRFTFDNFTGTEPIYIEKATVMLGNHFYPIMFGDSTLKPQIEIAPGKDVVSAPVDIDVIAGDTLQVSFYLKDFTQMRSSVYVQGPFSGGQYSLGDQTESLEFDIDISRNTNIVYFLSDVSLCTSQENHTILCYGDSITAQDWPDYLLKRCLDNGFKHTAIVRKATSGSRILREYSCITYESYGLMGKKRFPHEVFPDSSCLNGVDTIILQQGINDIIHPVGIDVNPFRPKNDLPSSAELIEGFKWYIDEARKAGLKVYAGTLLPIKGWRTYADFREKLKNEFNDFLRTTDLLDGCIDFEKALLDPDDVSAFLPAYDSGDHLHPSAAGYEKMAQIVPEALIR